MVIQDEIMVIVVVRAGYHPYYHEWSDSFMISRSGYLSNKEDTTITIVELSVVSCETPHYNNYKLEYTRKNKDEQIASEHKRLKIIISECFRRQT